MNKFKVVSTILFIIFLAIGCGSSGGEDTSTAETTTVSGTVVDGNGVPIEGAEVTIMSNPVIETTDANGYFKATVEVGNHEIVIKKGSDELYSGLFTCSKNKPLDFKTIKVGNNSAAGTYLYNSQNGELTVTIERTNYADDWMKDQPGTMITIISLTTTTLTMNNTNSDGQSTLTSNGSSMGDIVGTWTASDDDNSMMLTFRADGTWSINVEGSGNGSLDNLTGTWNGNYDYQSCLNSNCNSYTSKATFTIDQSDNKVTGTFSTSNGETGSILGNVAGSTFNFTVSETHPCVATLYGSGTISGNNIEYDLFGTVCTKDNSGSGSVTKE